MLYLFLVVCELTRTDPRVRPRHPKVRTVPYAEIYGSSSYLIYQSVTFQATRTALLSVQDGLIGPILLEGFSPPTSNPASRTTYTCGAA